MHLSNRMLNHYIFQKYKRIKKNKFNHLIIILTITHQVKKRQASESCLLGEAFWSSSWEQMQLQPPSKFAMTWARPRSVAAAKPSLKAWLLGSLHSNINSLRCFTCWRRRNWKAWVTTYTQTFFCHLKNDIYTLFCAISASMPRIPAMISIATINRQMKEPNNLDIVG